MGIYEEIGRVFKNSEDLTLGIEEEFQILDAATLALTNRYCDLREAASATLGEDFVQEELIYSEAEITSRKCYSFAELMDDMRLRRRILISSAEALGLKLCATGTHPFSPWEEQRLIDSAHYREVVDMLRLVAWTNNTFALHVHVGIHDPDRAIAICDAFRPLVPPLLALSASSPFLRAINTGLHSTRTQLFIRAFPRCGIPEPYGTWAAYADYAQFLFDTRSISRFDQMWWTLRVHHEFGTLEVRAPDAQPRFDESMAIAALVVALVATLMRLHDRGDRLPYHSGRFIEENRWRASRYGLDGRLIDLDRRVEEPAVLAVRRMMEHAAPGIAELGLEGHMPVIERMLAEGNSAQRQLRALESGADLMEIHRAMVDETMALDPAR